MDASVNDFLNEINQIAPKKSILSESEEVWQECFDQLTGYSYFWNTVTDEVTWSPPKSYVTNQSKDTVAKKKSELFIPPSAPLFPGAGVKPEAKVKIYSIQDNLENKLMQKTVPSNRNKKPLNKNYPLKHDDFNDEKIELISEYGNASDSDSELNPVENEIKPDSINQTEGQSDEEDDMDLLAKIQQRAQELKKLGGEVPQEVKNIIHVTPPSENSEKGKAISGFSLVAGYNSGSDSESEQEQTPPAPSKRILPVDTLPKVEKSHSSLFPITQPIDVTDFIGPNSQAPETVKPLDYGCTDFDSKAFQRKRRIGVSLINNSKKAKTDIEPGINEYHGLGFKTEQDQNLEEKKETSNLYPGFQKGGVMFVKSDVLNPSLSAENKKNENGLNEKEILSDRKGVEDAYLLLKEKLMFLGEGRRPVLPVQVMLIQAETLFLAMKEDGLKLSYLHKWLQETCSDLIKLEKEAAPQGWLLQWDRSHKRYFYQNQTSGESQWEYPQPDITRCDDAMDISTTPPPLEESESDFVEEAQPVVFGPQLPVDPPLPPSPPKIRVPTPPPPPLISVEQQKIQCLSDVPLPQSVLPSLPSALENGEPLPPGVDSPENVPSYVSKDTELKSADNLSSALDSFYSEIAEVDDTNNITHATSQITEINSEELQNQTNPVEITKKKKRKVKLAQGLTMKKKGVSELVEKWKHVQKSFGD